MKRPLIILGGGGHGKVLLDMLISQQAEIIGVCDPYLNGNGPLGMHVLGADAAVYQYNSDEVELVNGLGSTGVNTRRQELYQQFKTEGYEFAAVVHPNAIVAGDVLIGEGSQVFAGSILQTGTRLGANCIVNTGARVDHDCILGDHIHVAPGATICGDVEIGNGAHIGAGAVVIQGVRIGEASLVAAGAVVVRDVRPGAMVAGVPAREQTDA